MTLHTLLTEFAQSPKALAIARGYTPDEQTARDVLQDTCVIALEKLKLPHPTPWAWLYLTLKREAFALHRRRGVERRLAPTPAAAVDDPLEHLERRELLSLLELCKVAERQALLALAEGYSYLEIAERYGWTRTKVNRCISEGRARMRKELSNV